MQRNNQAFNTEMTLSDYANEYDEGDDDFDDDDQENHEEGDNDTRDGDGDDHNGGVGCERHLMGFEVRCLRIILKIRWGQRVTNAQRT